MLSEITKAFSFILQNSDMSKYHRDYLDNRLSKESQIKYQFGYFPKLKEIDIFESFFNKDILFDLKLLYEKTIYELPIRKENCSVLENHNLIMPYHDLYGNIVALVGRTILENYEDLKISKYKNTIFNKTQHLFGLYWAKENILDKDSAIVVEGQFDCLKAREKGISNIVALGSANMSDYQFSLLLRYTRNITLILDNDNAGNYGADKILNKFSKYANIKKVNLPFGYKDLDLFLDDFGIEELEKLI